MDEKTKKKALVIVKSAGDALKDCVDTGMYLVGKLHPALAALLGIAYLTKNLSGAAAGDERAEAVIKELGAFRVKMTRMVEKMSNNFTALKAFFTENQFWNDVPLQTFVLFQYMNDVLENPNDENHRIEFDYQYKKSDPVELAERLVYQLQREFMNPVKQAMKADPIRSKEIIVNWHGILESILSQLKTIEIMAAVWIHGEPEEAQKNVDDIRRVKMVQTKIVKFGEEFKKWEADYLNDHPYWPDSVRQHAETVLEENAGESCKALADRIAGQLEKILTTAEFYVLVFPDSLDYVKYERFDDNKLVVAQNAGFTAIVYRSFYAHKKSDVEYACNGIKIFYKGDDEKNTFTLHKGGRNDWLTEEELKNLFSMRLNGFNSIATLVAVKTDATLDGLAWTKSTMHNNGPGAYTYGIARRYKTIRGTMSDRYPFFILGGYN